MLNLLKLIVLFYYLGQAQTKQNYYWEKYSDDKNAEEAPERIIQLMRSYYEENHARIVMLNPLRFMYEESPYYEQGYVISEILERYRKMVETSQRVFKYNSDSFFDAIKRTELAQKLYFEIYHLVRMMHETPKKWTIEPEFQITEQIRPAGSDQHSLSSVNLKDEEVQGPQDGEMDIFNEYKHNLDVLAKQRKKDVREKRKLYKKIREEYLYNHTGKLDYATLYKHMEKKYNVQWPIDYGWEIDYEW